jgi:molecular chaperone DnaK
MPEKQDEISVIQLPEEGLFGIDYGAAYTCISEWMGDEHHLEDIKFPKFSNKRFPSTISYLPKFNQWVIGDLAEGCADKYPKTSFINLKRRIGENIVVLKQEEDEVTCEDILRNFFDIFRDFLFELLSPRKIEGAVVAVPYCFYEYQRSSVMKSIKDAKIPLLGLINEPDAILLAYCFEDRIQRQEENILVIDMGESTLDIALYEVRNKKKYIIINCLNIMGSPSVGGEDIDRILLKKILEKHSLQDGELWHNIFVKKQPLSGKLRSSLKELKHKLSTKHEESLMNIQLIQGQNLSQDITRTEFNEWIGGILSSINDYLHKTLDEVDMLPEKIDKVLVNGRTTRTPAIKELIEKLFAHQPGKVLYLNNDYLVSQGAAIYAAILKGKTERFGLNPINPYSIGVELSGGIFDDIIIKGKRLPCSDKKVYQMNNPDANAFDLNIYQGNAKTVNRNQLIIPVEMSGLNPLRGEDDYIIVNIDLDENGIGNLKLDIKSSKISWQRTLSGE